MKYAQINQQNEVIAFPCTLQQLVEAAVIGSETATASDLAVAGVVEVQACTTQTPDDEYLNDIRAIRQQDGTWKEEWVRLETTDEYKTAATARRIQRVLGDRQAYLNYSDWTQMPDVILANKTAWATYRQALRDVPAQQGFPWSITWPDRPTQA
jgi:hypothetical protein